MDDYKVVIDTDEIIDAKYINEVLLETQESWARRLYKRLFDDYSQNEEKKGKLSCAFSFGVSKHYMESDKKIMIVGQEANGHTIDYEQWWLKSWQEWAVDYLNFQVYDENSNNRNFSKNNSPFWQFIKKLASEKYGVCWNNLDKVRRYVKEDGKEWKEKKLPYDEDNNEREILNRKIFDGNGKSLLQKEIAIAKPDIVVFAVGPLNPYYHTLYSTLLDEKRTYDEILNIMKCPYPTVEKECCRINDYIVNLKMPVFYTYHPNYLKKSGKIEKVINQILGNKD